MKRFMLQDYYGCVWEPKAWEKNLGEVKFFFCIIAGHYSRENHLDGGLLTQWNVSTSVNWHPAGNCPFEYQAKLDLGHTAKIEYNFAESPVGCFVSLLPPLMREHQPPFCHFPSCIPLKSHSTSLVIHIYWARLPTPFSNRNFKIFGSVFTRKGLPNKLGLHFCTAVAKANNLFS